MLFYSLVARAAEEGETLQPWIVGCVAAVTVMAFASVVLRLTARWTRGQSLAIDDYLIIASMGLLFVVLGFVIGMVNYGMGIHATQLQMTEIVMIAKFLMVAEILYVINLALSKLSLLAMYYRIFPSRGFKLSAYIIGSFVIAWVITIVFVFIFLCVPVQKMWYVDLPGHCVNQVGTWCANAASTILTDFAILILPLPRVWKLQIGFVQRVSLIIIFGVGFFIVFTSAYRFSVLFQYSPLDPSWTLSKVVVWTVIEIAAGIVSANLPTLRPILRLVMSRFRTMSSTKDATTATGTNNKLTGGVHTGTGEQSNNGPFQRLDDSKLRPQHGSKVTSAIMSRSRTNSDLPDDGSLSGDEVPLQKIMVRTEVGYHVED